MMNKQCPLHGEKRDKMEKVSYNHCLSNKHESIPGSLEKETKITFSFIERIILRKAQRDYFTKKKDLKYSLD